MCIVRLYRISFATRAQGRFPFRKGTVSYSRTSLYLVGFVAWLVLGIPGTRRFMIVDTPFVLSWRSATRTHAGFLFIFFVRPARSAEKMLGALSSMRRAARPLIAARSTELAAVMSPLQARCYRSSRGSRMEYEPYFGQQAHATTILSVRKDNKVVRNARKLAHRYHVYAVPEKSRVRLTLLSRSLHVIIAVPYWRRSGLAGQPDHQAERTQGAAAQRGRDLRFRRRDRRCDDALRAARDEAAGAPRDAACVR